MDGVRFVSPLADGLHGAAVFTNERTLGSAWGLDAADAQRRARAEAVERLALDGVRNATAVTMATAAELGDRAVTLHEAVRCSSAVRGPREGPRFGWRVETPIPWIESERLLDPGSGALVPLDLVGLRPLGPIDVVLRPPDSTGAAAHRVRDMAVLHGLFECIERHETMRAHRHASSVRRIDIGHDEELLEITDALHRAGVAVVAGLLCSTFGTVTAIAQASSSDPALPAFAVGSATALDSAHATRAAILEAIQVFHFALQLVEAQEPGTAHRESPRNAAERALWWACGVARRTAPIVWVDEDSLYPPDDDASVTTQSPAESILSIASALSDDGHDVAVCDLVCESTDFVAVRVVIPTLLNRHADESTASDVTPCDPAGARNTLPHPFV